MDIYQLTILWIIIGLIIFPINLIYKAPYGRHTSKKWGVSIDNKLGWIIMELPALLVCPAIYFYFKIDFDISIMFICLWIIHYFNRTIIFPFRIKTKGKKMPDISKFKSVSVSMDTHSKLLSLAQNRFEVPVSVQKVIEFLLEKEIKKKNGRSNGKARR